MNYRALLLALTITATAQAQRIEDIPPGKDEIVSLPKGEKAPFDGQLFSNDTALRWGNWLVQLKTRLKADVEREQGICVAEKDFQYESLEIEKARAKTVEKDLKARLLRSEKARLKAEDEARNPPWYRSIWLGVGGGVVATLAATFAAVKITNSGR